MNSFEHLIGKIITKIQRIDFQSDYEFYSLYAIILSLESQIDKLVLAATNDGNAIGIKLTTEFSIETDFGLDFSEYVLNGLKAADELNQFVNQKIKNIRIAEFLEPVIEGNGFLIKQGMIAGVEVKTEKHKLLFKNIYGGWLDIDNDLAQLPNPERWRWK
ncbi:hypothetical protein [Adhaeribacter pallidiroseus]|uniref:Uncharacterized protein n=1 Tax=Adhaeribacter pallidiroseus TaxID=2072847 RepID=A0A369QRM5_9BACT|nr:hypothetical protein [Adhaeribacter pallidiroseus]RDC65966.1 hypothetical protein AHMF7616_04597 [Adhaeribacter pallidiroseus]